MYKRMMITVAVMLVAAACQQEPTGVATNEMLLAQQAQVIATDVAATRDGGTLYDGWIRRLFEALRNTDDPEARACLEEARALRQQARAAYEAGDRELARQLLHESFLKVLCAVLEVFPNAAERTGLAVDDAIARIENYLGDREAPRIRAILARVQELRVQAKAALASGDKVTALALNLKGLQILHRLLEHVRDGHTDHGDVADNEMQARDI